MYKKEQAPTTNQQNIFIYKIFVYERDAICAQLNDVEFYIHNTFFRLIEQSKLIFSLYVPVLYQAYIKISRQT